MAARRRLLSILLTVVLGALAAAIGCDERLVPIGVLFDAGLEDAGPKLPPLCADGLRDGDETAVDCGGSCGPCAYGDGCRVDTDCGAGRCEGGRCRAPGGGGTPAITFEALAPLPIHQRPTSVVIADLDRDGARDIAVANSIDLDYVTSVLPGRGDGTFRSLRDSPIADRGPTAYLAVGDLDEDRSLDLEVAALESLDVVTQRGRSDATFAPGPTTTAPHPSAIVAADLDGDGHLDLATTNYRSDDPIGLAGVTTLRGTGRGDFTFAGYSTLCAGPSAVVAGDFDGDRVLDLAVACRGFGVVPPPPLRDGGAAAVDLGAQIGSDLGIAPIVDLGVSRDLGVAPAADLVAGLPDASGPLVDGGALSDLAISPGADLGPVTDGSVAAQPDVFVLPGTGSLGWRAPIPYATGGGSCALAAADLDGDGLTDLAVASCDRSRVTVLAHLKGGPLQIAASYPVSPSPSAIVAADLDGDGRVDLATANADDNSVSVLRGLGGAIFDGALRVPVPGRRPVAIAAGDLDRDGKPDLAVAEYGSNDVGVLRNTSK